MSRPHLQYHDPDNLASAIEDVLNLSRDLAFYLEDDSDSGLCEAIDRLGDFINYGDDNE
jgi:hypothetical protein